jgi:hypothetical protein
MTFVWNGPRRFFLFAQGPVPASTFRKAHSSEDN